MIAAVRGVTAAAAARGSSVIRSGSMSANTGRAPAIMIASAEYAAESGEVITSSPGPIPSARSAIAERIGAGADADRVRRGAGRGELALEGVELGPEHEPAALQHARDCRAARPPHPRPASA